MKGAPESPTSPVRAQPPPQQQLQVPPRAISNRRQSPQQAVAVDSTLLFSPRKGTPINSRSSVASRGNAATVSLASRSRAPHASPQQQQPLAAQRSFNGSLLSNRTAGYSPAGGVADKILQQRLGSSSSQVADHHHAGTLRLHAEASAPAMMSTEPRAVRIGQIHGTIPSVRSQVVVVTGSGSSPSSIVRPSTTHMGQRAGVLNVSSSVTRPASRGPSGSSFGRSTVQKSPAFARWTPGAHSSSSRAWANGGTPDSPSGVVHQGGASVEKWAANRTMPASSRENMTKGIRNARPSHSLTSPMSNSAFASHRVTSHQHQQAAV